jgi:hypothetical protein
MSRLYRAIKKCLFEREKKSAYVVARRRAFARRNKEATKGEQCTKTWLMEGFEKHMEKEFKNLVIDDYFPKHWLAFHFCSFPIEDRFPRDAFVS